MQNKPELDLKYLGKITKDFAIVSDTLKEASYQVRSKGFSEYPIFPISKTTAPIGQLLIDQKKAAISWDFNITYIDEFINREIIKDVEAFKEAFRNPDEFCCLFVMDDEITNFIYIPYPED